MHPWFKHLRATHDPTELWDRVAEQVAAAERSVEQKEIVDDKKCETTERAKI